MNNLGKKRNVHLWKVGSKLVDNTSKHHDYYWVITKIDKEYVFLDAYDTYSDTYYGKVGKFLIDTLSNLSLSEIKVIATRLAKKMYPKAKEQGGYLLIMDEI